MDSFVRHQHFIERYKSGRAKDFLPFLKEVIQLTNNRLLSMEGLPESARLSKLKDLEFAIGSIFNQYTSELSAEMREFAAQEAAFSFKALDADGQPSMMLLQQIEAAYLARPFNNKLLTEYYKSFSESQAKQIINAINMGFFEGLSISEIRRNTLGARLNGGKGTTIHMTNTQANTMIRTSINHVAAVAKEQSFKNLGFERYEWVATLDSRTTEICKGLDGKVFTVGEGRLPPAHFGCRSTVIPV